FRSALFGPPRIEGDEFGTDDPRAADADRRVLVNRNSFLKRDRDARAPVFQFDRFHRAHLHTKNLDGRFVRDACDVVDGGLEIILRTEMDVSQHQDADHEDGPPPENKEADLAFGGKTADRLAVTHRLSPSSGSAPAPSRSRTGARWDWRNPGFF